METVGPAAFEKRPRRTHFAEEGKGSSAASRLHTSQIPPLDGRVHGQVVKISSHP